MSRAYSLSVLALLGTAVAAQVSPRGLSQSGADFVSRDYDYLVVGGGTAGLVVAARLSEDPKVSVGVIEAGQYLAGDPLVETPSSAFGMQGDPKYDWLFKSTPQPNLKDRVLDLARGKMLGGCSGINIMVFDRASKEEYDAWSTLGNSGWNWSGLLPFMKKAERFTGTDPFRINATDPNPKKIFPSQGTRGPVAASYNSWYTDLNIPFFKTMANAGVPFNSNPDSGNPLGSYNSAVSINGTTGKRSYAANTYYAYNAGRPNLFVLTGAQATKVNFSDKKVKGNVVASGVSFVSGSQTFSVKARKEVILSAGSFQSPQLLELSGIGNSTILKQFGIKPLVDLPGVGENLQDHLLIAASYELKPGKLTLDILRNNATYAAAAAAQYAATHDGPIAYSNSIISFVDIGSFVGKTKLDAMTAQLDKEIAGSTPLQSAQYAIQKQWLKQKLGNIEIISNPGYFGPSGPKANASYFSTILAIQHPFSRGNVHINSADPLAKATVSPQYLSKSFDQDVLVEAMKFSLKLSQTEPLASSIVARQDPPAGVTSDADLLDYIKTNAGSIWHPIGTAALAPKKLGGVVDSNLKVYGTNNVRVIDASVIPLHIATHITRTVYGIAEKAVASIKSGN